MAEPSVVKFPKQSGAPRQRTDATILADIKKAQRKLARAIDAALDAGLKVKCRIDSDDVWSGRDGHPNGQVRCLDPTVTREYK